MNKLIIPAIIGIFGPAPGTVTANAAESTTTSFSVQILKKKPKALKYGLKHGLKKGLKHGLKKGRINGGKIVAAILSAAGPAARQRFPINKDVLSPVVRKHI